MRTGTALRGFADPVKGFKKRDCFRSLRRYLYGPQQDRVLILYGLRRTGKTTLIRQILAEMTDEEILIAGESLLKTANEQAHADGVMDITFNGDDLALWIRYQEVKKAMQATSSGRRMLKAAATQAEIRQIYARNYGELMNYVQAVTEEYPWMRPVGTHVHYDTNTNNAVYCANINRHFVDSTIYEVAGQWKIQILLEKDIRRGNADDLHRHGPGWPPG